MTSRSRLLTSRGGGGIGSLGDAGTGTAGGGQGEDSPGSNDSRAAASGVRSVGSDEGLRPLLTPKGVG